MQRQKNFAMFFLEFLNLRIKIRISYADSPFKTESLPETRGGQPASETAGEGAGRLSAHPLPPHPPQDSSCCHPPQDSSCRYALQDSCRHTPPPAVGEGADCHPGGQAGPAGPGGQGKEDQWLRGSGSGIRCRFLTPGDPGWVKKIRIRIRDEQTGIIFPRA
jgi:hypothetical protein